MSNEKYSTFEVCVDDYIEYDDCGEKFTNSDKMWNDIKEFVRIATTNGYQVRMWWDGMTVAIEYNYRDASMSGVSLEWLGEDEYVCKASGEKEE